jgi:hypothetical protein
MGGPLLRMWQKDPFNQGSFYYQSGFDTMACTLAMVSAVGAPWVTKPGPGSPLGMPIPVLEGVALTNHITSTECGDRCAFTSKALMATGVVSGCLQQNACQSFRIQHRSNHFLAIMLAASTLHQLTQFKAPSMRACSMQHSTC